MKDNIEQAIDQLLEDQDQEPLIKRLRVMLDPKWQISLVINPFSSTGAAVEVSPDLGVFKKENAALKANVELKTKDPDAYKKSFRDHNEKWYSDAAALSKDLISKGFKVRLDGYYLTVK